MGIFKIWHFSSSSYYAVYDICYSPYRVMNKSGIDENSIFRIGNLKQDLKHFNKFPKFSANHQRRFLGEVDVWLCLNLIIHWIFNERFFQLQPPLLKDLGYLSEKKPASTVSVSCLKIIYFLVFNFRISSSLLLMPSCRIGYDWISVKWNSNLVIHHPLYRLLMRIQQSRPVAQHVKIEATCSLQVSDYLIFSIV